jgi:hypothetical protein
MNELSEVVAYYLALVNLPTGYDLPIAWRDTHVGRAVMAIKEEALDTGWCLNRARRLYRAIRHHRIIFNFQFWTGTDFFPCEADVGGPEPVESEPVGTSGSTLPPPPPYRESEEDPTAIRVCTEHVPSQARTPVSRATPGRLLLRVELWRSVVNRPVELVSWRGTVDPDAPAACITLRRFLSIIPQQRGRAIWDPRTSRALHGMIQHEFDVRMSLLLRDEPFRGMEESMVAHLRDTEKLAYMASSYGPPPDHMRPDMDDASVILAFCLNYNRYDFRRAYVRVRFGDLVARFVVGDPE